MQNPLAAQMLSYLHGGKHTSISVCSTPLILLVLFNMLSTYLTILTVQPRHWTPLNATEKVLETDAVRDQIEPALRSLAPNSGAYVNEADPSSPNWKRDYYGANYEKLLQIKTKWDPDGVFWCKPCVGYDEWEIVPVDYATENENEYERGIGQDQIMLCKMINSTAYT